MKNYSIFYTIVVMFNYFFLNVLAENKYYIVSIRRNPNDKEYDKVNSKTQNKINDLVNDRMNDIYNIIADNKETYIKDDGKLDKKLEELSIISQLRKRSEIESLKNKNFKFQFINRNRPQSNNSFKLNSLEDEDPTEYIPFESNLVKHICPVSNYYVVIAYLSDELVNEIKKLPNVINIEESKTTQPENVINYNSSNYYNREEILKETHWSDLSVQELKPDLEFRNSHLSLLSQGKFNGNSKSVYDSNYYYPSTAGKGIDIFIMDDGLNMSLSEENFDTYEGTSDERIVRCDGEFYDGVFHSGLNKKHCYVKNKTDVKHGTLVSISAIGKLNGVAKKANLHMLATDFTTHDQLNALDYIKQNAKPHKTVVNISRGCSDNRGCYSQEIQDKITELVDFGIIIIVSGGNTNKNSCKHQIFRSCKGVIPIGAIGNVPLNDFNNINVIYQRASYSSYGECIVLFAPGTIRVTDTDINKVSLIESGTSFASPLVAGVAATIMAEDPNTKYDFDLMKKKLIDLSIKDILKNLDSTTVNRLVNNGKLSVYQPPRCDDPTGQSQCQDKCCSKYGYCVDPQSSYSNIESFCLIENGCQSEFGFCYTKKCGKNHNMRKCLEDECCSEDGECIKILNDKDNMCFLENGCESEFSGQCLSRDLNNLDKYDEKYQNKILEYNCEMELKPYNNACFDDFTFLSKKRDDLCSQYQNFECEEFYKTPYKYIPSCERIGRKINIDKYSSNISQLMCAKKNPKTYCLKSNAALFDNYFTSVQNRDKFVKENCQSDVCRLSLLKYLTYEYNDHKDTLFKNDRKIYEDAINYLSSEKCISHKN